MRSISLLSLAVLSGCTAHLRPHPEVHADGVKLPMRAALVVPPELEHAQNDIGKFDSLSGSYVFDTGDTVLPAVKEVAQRVFQSVDVVPNVNAAGSADIIIQLKAMKVVHPSGRSNDYGLRFDLRTLVTKADGVQIWDGSYTEEVKGLPLQRPEDALTAPVQQTIADTLQKLAMELRTQLGAGTPPPDQVAQAQSGEFSDFPAPPPPPPGSTPGSTSTNQAPPPSNNEPIVLEGLGPTPAPPVKPSGGGGFNVALVGGGAALFVASYFLPPIWVYSNGEPGANNPNAFIPIAGPLMAVTQNPFTQFDQAAFAMAIAATVGQIVGLGVAVFGLLSGGGNSSGNSNRRASLLEGNGWSMTPTVSTNGFGLVINH